MDLARAEDYLNFSPCSQEVAEVPMSLATLPRTPPATRVLEGRNRRLRLRVRRDE